MKKNLRDLESELNKVLQVPVNSKLRELERSFSKTTYTYKDRKDGTKEEIVSTHSMGRVVRNDEWRFEFRRGISGTDSQVRQLATLSWWLPDYLGTEIREWIRKEKREFLELTLSRHICLEILLVTLKDSEFYGNWISPSHPGLLDLVKNLKYRQILPKKEKQTLRRRGYPASTELSSHLHFDSDQVLTLDGKRVIVRKAVALKPLAGEKHQILLTSEYLDLEEKRSSFSRKLAALESYSREFGGETPRVGSWRVITL